MRARDGRPLVLIDIAVPRDVEPACAELDGVTLYDIDDLQAVVARNLQRARGRARATPRRSSRRRSSASRAGWAQLEVLPTIAALREHGDEIVEQVLAENAGAGRRASPRDLARVEAMARAVDAAPAARADDPAEGDGRRPSHGRLQLLRELFGLRARRRRRGDGRRRQRAPTSAVSAGVRIGTRGSALALAQAQPVAEALGGEPSSSRSSRRGDRGAAPTATRRAGSRELERALLDGEIDVAVHSAKDVPASWRTGSSLAAAPPRADPRDALCGAPSLDDAGRGRARRHVVAAARGAAARAARPTSRSSSCAATSTRGCASSPTASSTRSCSPPPGCERLGRARRGRAARRARARRGPGHAGARGAGRRGRRAWRRSTDAPSARALRPSARSCARSAPTATRRSARTRRRRRRADAARVRRPPDGSRLDARRARRRRPRGARRARSRERLLARARAEVLGR